MSRLLNSLIPISERTQRRAFPVLAVIAVVVLVAWLVETVGVKIGLGSLYFFSFLAVVLAQLLATYYLGLVRSLIRMTAEAAELPDWVEAQAEKNHWKGGIIAGIGMALTFVVVWCSTKKLLGESWFIGLMALNLAFQVGAFAGEFVVINAQGRLFRDVQGWAKKPELAQANREL